MKSSIERIFGELRSSDKIKSPKDLRVGLITFRDHPPRSTSYITREWPFTSDLNQMVTNLRGVELASGGDLPEAITTALDKALKMNWSQSARKIIVLVSDAPPHGIGGDYDDHPDGVPGGSNLYLFLSSYST